MKIITFIIALALVIEFLLPYAWLERIGDFLDQWTRNKGS